MNYSIEDKYEQCWDLVFEKNETINNNMHALERGDFPCWGRFFL